MSARTTVTLGVWALLMVLVGTLTVGLDLAFYAAITTLYAIVVAVIMLVVRHRVPPRDQHRLG